MTYSTEVAAFITDTYRTAAAAALRGESVESNQAIMTRTRQAAGSEIDFDAIDAEVSAADIAEHAERAAANRRAAWAYKKEYNYLIKRDMFSTPEQRRKAGR
jgi:hypothetical protein